MFRDPSIVFESYKLLSYFQGMHLDDLHVHFFYAKPFSLKHHASSMTSYLLRSSTNVPNGGNMLGSLHELICGGFLSCPCMFFTAHVLTHLFSRQRQYLAQKNFKICPKKSRKIIEKYRLQQGWVARVEISRLDKSLRRLWLALVPFGIKCQLSTFTKYKRTILEIHCRAVFSLCFFFIQVLAIYFEQPQKQEGQ